jgi:hypothetical protein
MSWSPKNYHERNPMSRIFLMLSLVSAVAVASQSIVREKSPYDSYHPELPEGAVTYEGEKFTQSIAVVDQFDVIKRVPTSKHDNDDWKQPGGLRGIKGWTQERYVYLPKEPVTEVRSIQVKNSFGYYQPNRAIVTTFPVGTEFHDLLSCEGKVFEHRCRVKRANSWQNVIIYVNPQARPDGYNGLTQACASCHKSRDDKGPGSGDYDGPLAPGSDTVFSYTVKWSVWRAFR